MGGYGIPAAERAAQAEAGGRLGPEEQRSAHGLKELALGVRGTDGQRDSGTGAVRALQDAAQQATEAPSLKRRSPLTGPLASAPQQIFKHIYEENTQPRTATATGEEEQLLALG